MYTYKRFILKDNTKPEETGGQDFTEMANTACIQPKNLRETYYSLQTPKYHFS